MASTDKKWDKTGLELLVTDITATGTSTLSTAVITTLTLPSDTSQTLTGAGAINTTSKLTELVTTGANALTLAAPTVEGLVKIIRLKTDGGDGTLASTNIVGQSSGSTSITFNDAGDTLVLIGSVAAGKWYVLKESGVVAA